MELEKLHQEIQALKEQNFALLKLQSAAKEAQQSVSLIQRLEDAQKVVENSYNETKLLRQKNEEIVQKAQKDVKHLAEASDRIQYLESEVTSMKIQNPHSFSLDQIVFKYSKHQDLIKDLDRIVGQGYPQLLDRWRDLV